VLSTVHGRTRIAFLLGFTEVSIWLFVISIVIDKISENPIIGVFYALGFATGNVVGIILERHIAFGNVNLRVFSTENGKEMASQVRELGFPVTTFKGEGISGPVTELYVMCTRRDLKKILQTVHIIEKDAFYVTEPVGIVRKSGRLSMVPRLGLRLSSKNK
jgi:uncharacterized protein YebE (UPF0316 family)